MEEAREEGYEKIIAIDLESLLERVVFSQLTFRKAQELPQNHSYWYKTPHDNTPLCENPNG